MALSHDLKTIWPAIHGIVTGSGQNLVVHCYRSREQFGHAWYCYRSMKQFGQVCYCYRYWKQFGHICTGRKYIYKQY